MSSAATTLPGQDTLIACWRALALTSSGAEVICTGATTAAVFPSWAPLNNAILSRGVDVATATVTDELADVYGECGVDVWALWVPSGAIDLDAPDELHELGTLIRDTTTLVMQTTLNPGLRTHEAVVRASLASIVRTTDDEPVPAADLGEPETAPGLTAWAMVQDGVAVTSAWTFLHGRDCGIYAVETLSPWRRRGLARSLMEHVLADAYDRGARTASLQSTRMGEPLYESLGFEPAGRYEEWISQ